VGYSRHELLQTTFQEITHPDDLDTDMGYVSQMLSGVIETYTMDKRYIRKNGSIVWIRLTVSLHKKTDGSPNYFISVIEDISLAKDAENELKKLHSQTERLLSQQVVTQTVMALAHDLNQPLNAAGSYSEAAMRLLQQEVLDKQKLGEIIKFNVTQIQKAGDVLRKLIQSVNRNNESDELLDLIKSVHESIFLFKDESYSAPIEIDVECLCPTINVLVKKVFLHQSLINLFRNAQQAMEAFTGEQGILKISVRIQLNNDCADVAIIDNGTGINEAVAKDLFKPFFTTKADGIGMGLAISRAMIESCGGKLWYQPVAGKTAFHISLPNVPHGEPVN
jgi:PAS domain S-box-containing protein